MTVSSSSFAFPQRDKLQFTVNKLISLSLQRRNSQLATMARDSRSQSSNNSQPSSYCASHSSSSRSRVSANGGAVQPPTVTRGRPRYSDDDTLSNVTGFREDLYIPGLPREYYFNSGASKFHRPIEYTYGRSSGYSGSMSDDVPQGNEVVRYTSGRRNDTPEDSDDNDNATIRPEDSQSQRSSNRSVSSQHSRSSYQPHRSSRSHHAVRAPPTTTHGCNSYHGGSGSSVYEGETFYDKNGRYIYVERSPRRR